jgi:hypothetical protein
MRFGTSAKKIENKITANITKDCDEEGLKAIISDYETKIKDFENDRDKIDELKREHQLLENDHVTLKQRLMKVNESLILNKAPSQTSPEGGNIENAVMHWDGIGLINTTTKVKNTVDSSQLHDGWKIAAVEIKPDKNFVRSIENSLNSQLKKAALETKKYAGQVKKENTNLMSKLEKANKKIKNIELAKGFDKCSEELLDKWEKIFTNCLIEVSKEKGKREAKKDMKKIKSEFKKVVALNSYLHNQIESINETKLLKRSASPQFNNGNDPSSESSPFVDHQSANYDFRGFQTANPISEHENLKENVNMYMTNQNDNIAAMNNMFMNNGFPVPPLVDNKSESDLKLEEYQSNSVAHHSESNSSNEIENIIMSKSHKSMPKKEQSDPVPVHQEVNFHDVSDSVIKSSDKDDSESIEFNNNMRGHGQHPDTYIHNYLNKAKISSSLILEHLNDFAVIPQQKTQMDDEQEYNMDFSPITPMNLSDKLNIGDLQRIITPDLLRRASSSEFGEISEGNLK